MFLRDYCLRPSCYECVAKKEKMSDLTIADFWGINNIAPEMNDGKGTSLVLVRTEVGKRLFEKVSHDICFKEVCYDEAVRGNPAEYRSPDRPTERDTFFKDLQLMSFDDLQKTYLKPKKITLTRKIKNTVKRILKINGGGYSIKDMDYYLCFILESEVGIYERDSDSI